MLSRASERALEIKALCYNGDNIAEAILGLSRRPGRGLIFSAKIVEIYLLRA